MHQIYVVPPNSAILLCAVGVATPSQCHTSELIGLETKPGQSALYNHPSSLAFGSQIPNTHNMFWYFALLTVSGSWLITKKIGHPT